MHKVTERPAQVLRVAGIAFGALVTQAISVLATWLPLIAPSAVGIFFGSYPAQKAARLNPIEALRYE